MNRRIILSLFFGMLLLCSCSAPQKNPKSKTVLNEVTMGTSEKVRVELNESNREVYNKAASYAVTYKSLDEIEAASDLVVKVTALDSEELCFNQPDIKNGVFPMGYVLTSVSIDAVYKSNEVVETGDVVKIEEYYTTALNSENNTTLVYSYGFYNPMLKNHQYILFLKSPQNSGDYEIVRFDLGKYAVNDTISTTNDIRKLNCAELEVSIQENSSQQIPPEYFDIAEQVREKYK